MKKSKKIQRIYRKNIMKKFKINRQKCQFLNLFNLCSPEKVNQIEVQSNLIIIYNLNFSKKIWKINLQMLIMKQV